MKTIYRVQTYELKSLPIKIFSRIQKARQISAEIWNFCIEASKSHYKETGKWISKTKLQKLTKRKYPLHSQTIQAVVHKYINARDSAREARAKGYDNKYPWRKKKWYPLMFGEDAITVKDNRLILSMGTWETKRQEPLTLKLDNLPKGDIVKVEFAWNDGLILRIVWDDNIEAALSAGTDSAAIDLGEIHSIASVATNGKGILITGKLLRSIKRLRSKQIARLQRKLASTTEGSRKWKRYKRALRETKRKSRRQLEVLLNQITNEYVQWCIANNIGKVFIGNPEGVQRNTRKEKKANRNTAQKLSQWQFGAIKQKLQYKLERKGIKVEIITEEYTTQTCPACGRKHKPKDRNYTCWCGYTEHRDYHGANGILTKGLYGTIKFLHTYEGTYRQPQLEARRRRREPAHLGKTA